ncbi:uncharacterized protein LOC143144338 isoform X2 [Ptiloglossa arizonensis]|uniref:uncharacterized protein LOC143144338 isoform X2 n=1 Tax=Ptiloglossa arizonensis TaxID=3350558 RepID=UPI003F9FE2B8
MSYEGQKDKSLWCKVILKRHQSWALLVTEDLDHKLLSRVSEVESIMRFGFGDTTLAVASPTVHCSAVNRVSMLLPPLHGSVEPYGRSIDEWFNEWLKINIQIM